jgi:hypothetical protein
MSSRKEEENRIKERERQFRVSSANLSGASNILPKASEPGDCAVESTPELVNIWSKGPGGQADGGPKNSRDEMEKETKDRGRQFQTAKPEAVALSEPDASGSLTVPTNSSASSNVWGTKKLSSQAPSTASSIVRANPSLKTDISPKPKSTRELEDERIKERERSFRTTRVTDLAGRINTPGQEISPAVQVSEPEMAGDFTAVPSASTRNVWGANKHSSTETSSSSVSSSGVVARAPTTNVSPKPMNAREQEDERIKERERAARTAMVSGLAGYLNEGPVSEPEASGEVTVSSDVYHASSNIWGSESVASAGNLVSIPSSTNPKPSEDSSNVWGANKKAQVATPAAAARAPSRISSKGPSTREQEELAIKERERAARMTTMTTPFAGQGRSSISNSAPVSVPDKPASFTRQGAARAPVVNQSGASSPSASMTSPRDPIRISSKGPSTREQEELAIKERERAARMTTMTTPLAGQGRSSISNSAPVSVPDIPASFTRQGAARAPVVNQSGASSPSASMTSPRGPIRISSIKRSTEQEDEQIKNLERQNRATGPGISVVRPGVVAVSGAGAVSGVGESRTVRDPIRISSLKRSTEQEDAQIKDRERQFRTSTAASGTIVSTTSPGDVVVSGVDQSQTSANSSVSASTRAPIRISTTAGAGNNETTTKGLVDEDERIKACERQNRTAHVTGLTTPAGGNILTAPDVELVEVSVWSVNGTNTTESSEPSTVKSRVVEDERIKARARQNRAARVSNLAGSTEGTPGACPTYLDEPEALKGVVEEDDHVKSRERQSRVTQGAVLPGLVACSVTEPAGSIIEAPQTQNPDSDEMIKQRAKLTATVDTSNLVHETTGLRSIQQFQSVVSEAYTANPVDRSAISSRNSTLPEKSSTGPRIHGVGAIAATDEGGLQHGKSIQPGVVRDDSAADEMIRAKRGRHAANVGNSVTGTSTFDLEVRSEPQVEQGEVPVKSKGQPQEEFIPKGAFAVYTNGIIVQQQPGRMSVPELEAVPEINSAAFPPPDPEKPDNGSTTDPIATGIVPDELDIDGMDNKGKPEDVPFYKSRKFLALIGFVVLTAIAIGVGVALSGGGDDGLKPEPTAAPTEDPIYQERETYLILFLENEGLDVESLEDPGSYQRAAFNWIVKDDEISRIAENITDEEIQVALSRYVLAVFYFSLNGSFWISDIGWLNDTLGHCSWEFISCNGAGLVTSINTGSFLEYLADLVPFQAALGQGGNQLEGILPSELKYFSSLGEYIHIFS